jgi:hypothetical protein
MEDQSPAQHWIVKGDDARHFYKGLHTWLAKHLQDSCGPPANRPCKKNSAKHASASINQNMRGTPC